MKATILMLLILLRDRDNNYLAQNSSVHVVAKALQILSLKEKKSLYYKEMPFYGVVD